MNETPNLNSDEAFENINQEPQPVAESESEYPEFDKEKAQQLRDEYNNDSSNDGEAAKDKERSMIEQQREDLSVLFSFCDEEDIMDILHSDEYGKLLENQISLLDLFNANALFNEQYDYRGVSKDYAQRHYTNEVHTKLNNFKDRRRQHLDEKYKYINDYYNEAERYGKMLADQDYEESEEKEWLEEQVGWNYNAFDMYYNDAMGGTADDKIRAEDAKDVIADIAYEYFDGENDDVSAIDTLKTIIALRANGEKLSGEQKDFLASQYNCVADRLLFDGKVINSERVDNMFNALQLCIKDYEADKIDIADFSNRLAYSAEVVNDFLQAGYPELVYHAQSLLKETVDEYFDDIFSEGDYKYLHGNMDMAKEIFLDYSNPFKMVENAKKYDLVRRYDERGNIVHDGIISNPESIIERITAARGSRGDVDVYISHKAKDLKELGVDDDVIMKYCNRLHPVDFINAETTDGTGARLLEAGIDKQKVLNSIFSSNYANTNPFEKQGYRFNGESYFDVLERNGFSATEIAQTFSPDDIARNLPEFLERGADAKELMKYMMSYHEEFNANISPGGTMVYKMWFDGYQDMTVWDRNHPQGRTIKKQGIGIADGSFYVAANFDKFADYGVSEEDILNEMPDGYASPNNHIIPEMIKCGKFDTAKILQKGFEKEKKYFEKRLERGTTDEEYVKITLTPIRYAADIFKRAYNDDESYYNPVREIKQAMSKTETE